MSFSKSYDSLLPFCKRLRGYELDRAYIKYTTKSYLLSLIRAAAFKDDEKNNQDGGNDGLSCGSLGQMPQ